MVVINISLPEAQYIWLSKQKKKKSQVIQQAINLLIEKEGGINEDRPID